MSPSTQHDSREPSPAASRVVLRHSSARSSLQSRRSVASMKSLMPLTLSPASSYTSLWSSASQQQQQQQQQPALERVDDYFPEVLALDLQRAVHLPIQEGVDAAGAPEVKGRAGVKVSFAESVRRVSDAESQSTAQTSLDTRPGGKEGAVLVDGSSWIECESDYGTDDEGEGSSGRGDAMPRAVVAVGGVHHGGPRLLHRRSQSVGGGPSGHIRASGDILASGHILAFGHIRTSGNIRTSVDTPLQTGRRPASASGISPRMQLPITTPRTQLPTTPLPRMQLPTTPRTQLPISPPPRTSSQRPSSQCHASPVITSPVIKSPVIKSPVITSPVIKSPIIKPPVITSPKLPSPPSSSTTASDNTEPDSSPHAPNSDSSYTESHPSPPRHPDKPPSNPWLGSALYPYPRWLHNEEMAKVVPLPPDAMETLRVSVACFPETMLLSSSLTIETIRTYAHKVRQPSLEGASPATTPPACRKSLWRKVVPHRIPLRRHGLASHHTLVSSSSATLSPPQPWEPLKFIFSCCSDYICDALYAHIVAFNYISTLVAHAPTPTPVKHPSPRQHIPKKAASLLGLAGAGEVRRATLDAPAHSPVVSQENLLGGLMRCIAQLMATAKLMTDGGGEDIVETEPGDVDFLLVRCLCEVVRMAEDS